MPAPSRVPNPHPSTSRPPPPPIDYGKRPVGEAFQHGLGQLPQTTLDMIYGTPVNLIKGAYHAARQRFGAEPVQPGFNRLAIQAGDDPYVVSDLKLTGQQVGDWANKNFGTTQRAWETAKRTWANDPATVVSLGLNAAHALSAGAGALSRAPAIAATRAGPVLRRVSGVAGAVANPTRTLTRAVRGAPITESLVQPNGELHPKVNAALESAAKGSSREAGLDPATGQPVNPPFRQQVVSTMSRKGPTPDAAREAILRHHLPDDTAVPRTAATGEEAPAQAQQRAQGLTDKAMRASGQQIATGPGLSAPSEFAIDPATGQMTGSTRSARLFTDYPSSAGVFTPQEASDARLATHAQDILGAPLDPNTKVGWGPAVRTTLTGLAGAGLGTVGAMAGLGHGGVGLMQNLGAGALDLGIGALTGGMAGVGERFGVEPLFRAGERQAQGWGAPARGGPLVTAASIGAPAIDAGLRYAPLVPQSGAPASAAAPEKQPDASNIPDEWQAPPPVSLAPPTTPIQQTNAPAPEASPEPSPDATPTPAAAAPPSHGKQSSRVPSRIDNSLPDEWKPAPAPAPQAQAQAQADGGRVGYARGGEVADLTEKLLKRAEGAARAARASTKPILGLSDDVVARALNVAQRGF